MIFKVMGGSHHDRVSNNTYEQGDVFQSNYQLDKVFVNKFQHMPDTEPTTKPADGSVVAPVVVKSAPVAAVADVPGEEPNLLRRRRRNQE